MTSLQIEYWKNRESQRHNIQMENLTGQQNAETAKHNRESERIGYAQAAAAQAQASAAMRQAEIQYRLSQLQELRTEYDVQIAKHQMQLIDAQAAYQRSSTALNYAKQAQQELETGVYSIYGSLAAAADLSYKTQQYYQSQAHTELMREQATTENYRRIQYVTQSAQQGVSTIQSVLQLFKKKK